jgi:hypothetical protein
VRAVDPQTGMTIAIIGAIIAVGILLAILVWIMT